MAHARIRKRLRLSAQSEASGLLGNSRDDDTNKIDHGDALWFNQTLIRPSVEMEERLGSVLNNSDSSAISSIPENIQNVLPPTEETLKIQQILHHKTKNQEEPKKRPIQQSGSPSTSTSSIDQERKRSRFAKVRQRHNVRDSPNFTGIFAGNSSEEKENSKQHEVSGRSKRKAEDNETMSKTFNSPTIVVKKKRPKFSQKNKRRSSVNAFEKIFNEDLGSSEEGQSGVFEKSGANRSKDVSNQMHVDYEEEIQDRSLTTDLRSIMKPGRDKTVYEASMAFTPVQGRGTLNLSRKSDGSRIVEQELSKDKNATLPQHEIPVASTSVDRDDTRISRFQEWDTRNKSGASDSIHNTSRASKTSSRNKLEQHQKQANSMNNTTRSVDSSRLNKEPSLIKDMNDSKKSSIQAIRRLLSETSSSSNTENSNKENSVDLEDGIQVGSRGSYGFFTHLGLSRNRSDSTLPNIRDETAGHKFSSSMTSHKTKNRSISNTVSNRKTIPVDGEADTVFEGTDQSVLDKVLEDPEQHDVPSQRSTNSSNSRASQQSSIDISVLEENRRKENEMRNISNRRNDTRDSKHQKSPGLELDDTDTNSSTLQHVSRSGQRDVSQFAAEKSSDSKMGRSHKNRSGLQNTSRSRGNETRDSRRQKSSDLESDEDDTIQNVSKSTKNRTRELRPQISSDSEPNENNTNRSKTQNVSRSRNNETDGSRRANQTQSENISRTFRPQLSSDSKSDENNTNNRSESRNVSRSHKDKTRDSKRRKSPDSKLVKNDTIQSLTQNQTLKLMPVLTSDSESDDNNTDNRSKSKNVSRSHKELVESQTQNKTLKLMPVLSSDSESDENNTNNQSKSRNVSRSRKNESRSSRRQKSPDLESGEKNTNKTSSENVSRSRGNKTRDSEQQKSSPLKSVQNNTNQSQFENASRNLRSKTDNVGHQQQLNLESGPVLKVSLTRLSKTRSSGHQQKSNLEIEQSNASQETSSKISRDSRPQHQSAKEKSTTSALGLSKSVSRNSKDASTADNLDVPETADKSVENSDMSHLSEESGRLKLQSTLQPNGKPLTRLSELPIRTPITSKVKRVNYLLTSESEADEGVNKTPLLSRKPEPVKKVNPVQSKPQVQSQPLTDEIMFKFKREVQKRSKETDRILKKMNEQEEKEKAEKAAWEVLRAKIEAKRAAEKKKALKPKKPIDKAYLVNGKVYKPPRLPTPKDWATKKLYKYLMNKLEPKFGMEKRLKAEEFVKQLSDYETLIMKKKTYDKYKDILNQLHRTMAKLGLIKTREDFTHFCQDYMPFSFRNKVIPIHWPSGLNIPFNPSEYGRPILEEGESGEEESE